VRNTLRFISQVTSVHTLWDNMSSEYQTNPHQDGEVSFLIGAEPESICTKISPLVDRSPVFRAMLEGPLANKSKHMIKIHDVDPRAFENLLR